MCDRTVTSLRVLTLGAPQRTCLFLRRTKDDTEFCEGEHKSLSFVFDFKSNFWILIKRRNRTRGIRAGLLPMTRCSSTAAFFVFGAGTSLPCSEHECNVHSCTTMVARAGEAGGPINVAYSLTKNHDKSIKTNIRPCILLRFFSNFFYRRQSKAFVGRIVADL